MQTLPVTFQSKITAILTTFLLFMLLPSIASGLSIDDLTTDFSQKKTAETQTKSSLDDLKDSFFNGNIQFLMQRLNNLPQEQQQLPDVLALRAIGFIAGNQFATGRELLSDAETKNADERYILYAKAMLHRSAKDYANAEQTIHEAIAADKNHPYAWNILGRIQFDQQQYQEALSSFHQAIDLNTDFLPAYLNLGAAYFQIQNYPKALEFFTAASDLNPLEDRAYLGQAWSLEAIKNYPEAITALQRYIDLKGESFESLEYLAELQNKAADYKGLSNTGKLLANTDKDQGLIWQARADIYLNQLDEARLKLDTTKIDSADKHYLLSLIHIISGNFEAAHTSAQQSLEQNPSYLAAQLAAQTANLFLNGPIKSGQKTGNSGEKSSINLYFSALNALQHNNLKQAFQSFNGAENFIPGFSMAGMSESSLKAAINGKEVKHIGLGTFYYFIKMPERAKNTFQSVVKGNPDSLLANYWLGQLSLEQGEKDKAFAYFSRSITSTPFFPSLYSMAELSLIKGNTDEAIKYYQQALKLKSDAGILIKLGLLYESMEDKISVENIYTRLIEEHESLFIGYNQLAWYYTKNNIKLDKAMSLAQKANELQPGNSSILDTMGWLYYKKGDLEQAEKYLSQANQILANNPSVLYHLGMLHKAKGDTELARKHIEQALSLNPNFDEAPAARNIINNL